MRAEPSAIPEALNRAAEAALAANPRLSAVLLFGSRARGDHRPDSDWDLAFLTSGERIERVDPEGWRPPGGGMTFDCLQVPLAELERKANALAHIACPLVREGRVIAGVRNRPATGKKPAMEEEEYAKFLRNSVNLLGRAVAIPAELPTAFGPGWDADECGFFVAWSADGAEFLAKAMLGRIGLEFPRTHDLSALAARFGDAHPELRDAVRAPNGAAREDHTAGYEARLDAEAARRAAARLSGAVRLVADELRAAAADNRFRDFAGEAAGAAVALFGARAEELRAAGGEGASDDPVARAVLTCRPALAEALETAVGDLAGLVRQSAARPG